MSNNVYRVLLILIAVGFTVFFTFTIIPPLIANPDLIAAIAAGFVNPYASGYSTDVILCWVVLLVWIVYDAGIHNIKGGWVCAVLGLVPGVAVGLAVYLLLRDRQLSLR